MKTLKVVLALAGLVLIILCGWVVVSYSTAHQPRVISVTADDEIVHVCDNGNLIYYARNHVPGHPNQIRSLVVLPNNILCSSTVLVEPAP